MRTSPVARSSLFIGSPKKTTSSLPKVPPCPARKGDWIDLVFCDVFEITTAGSEVDQLSDAG